MVTVAVREGAPLNGVPVIVTVNFPVGKLQDSVDETELTVELRVAEEGCRLQV